MTTKLHTLSIYTILVTALSLGACENQSNSTPEGDATGTADQHVPYLDTDLPLDRRVDDLLSRMTPSEKIAQMYNDAPAVERLGIPKYDWWNEALHGVARAGKATVFPQAIGMAAAFNKPLLHEVATAVSDEARAKHHHFADNGLRARYTGLTFWSPNVNIFRDPRWGRGQETYGEDPYLTGSLAVEFITGMQGDHDTYLKSSAMAKHYAVHSGPEKSRHSDDYRPTVKDLWETYLPAFEMAVNEADVESIMCAYNRVNGDPACGNTRLLQDILRGKWGFDGHVVSDCGALADFFMPTHHDWVLSPADAAIRALRAGTDLNCGTHMLSVFSNLNFAVHRDLIDESEIDTAVARLFKTRFKLGMFDPPEQVPYTDIPMSVVGSEEHLKLAQRISEQSLVLLKNDGILPLDKGIRVAVIGPNATNPAVLLGNYNGDPIAPVTPLEGIQAYAGDDNVRYAPGSPLIGDIYGHYQTVPAERFFHRADGELKPGLTGAYYKLTPERKLENEPAMSRTDDNIDFHWRRSPIDDAVGGGYGVVWKGVLVPAETGEYRFQTEATVVLDGGTIEGPVELTAGTEYDFRAEMTFPGLNWRAKPEPSVRLAWLNASKDFVKEALSAAQQSDVVIFAGGISPDLEGEEMEVELDGFDHGDRTSIDLPRVQLELLKRLKRTGKPVVLINFSGSAMAMNWEDENLNAIVQGFYPGEAAGTALARLLWGEYSPSGRLPVTFYRGVDQLPGFKDYHMAHRTYKYFKGKPLYPFGYGLSYSEFAYSDLQAPASIKAGDGLELTVTLKNNGPMDAAQVTQVYVTMAEAPVPTPNLELAAYTRTELADGGEKQVQVSVSPDRLRYVDNMGDRHPYTGPLKVTVGGGQPGFVEKGQIVETTVTVE